MLKKSTSSYLLQSSCVGMTNRSHASGSHYMQCNLPIEEELLNSSYVDLCKIHEFWIRVFS